MTHVDPIMGVQHPGKWFKGRGDDMPDPGTPVTVRRWDGAQTNRLNAAHWLKANGQTINQDLGFHLATLRARCAFEASTNTDAEGVIATHVADLVGDTGPILQVVTKDTKYADDLERIWRDWWAMPDINGVLAGVDMLDLWVRSFWTNGEFLVQYVTDRATREKNEISLRLRCLDPGRLDTPLTEAGKSGWVLGVKRTKTGKPTHYAILDVAQDQPIVTSTIAKVHTARSILHVFKTLEADQARGVPWMASALQVMADLRDYDVDVQDAARMAANFSVFFTASNPDTKFVEFNDSLELERGTGRALPPGYKADQVSPEQPATAYKDFKHEKLRAIGRVVSMPLLRILLDSGDANFSSARLDAIAYQRVIGKDQKFLERKALAPIRRKLSREAELAGMLGTEPDDVQYVYIWERFAFLDPKNEQKGNDTAMRNGSRDYSHVAIEQGIDEDALRERLARQVKAFRQDGLMHPMDALKGKPEASAVPTNGAAKGINGNGRMTQCLTG